MSSIFLSIWYLEYPRIAPGMALNTWVFFHFRNLECYISGWKTVNRLYKLDTVYRHKKRHKSVKIWPILLTGMQMVMARVLMGRFRLYQRPLNTILPWGIICNTSWHASLRAILLSINLAICKCSLIWKWLRDGWKWLSMGVALPTQNMRSRSGGKS